jgi:superfamily II DNA helicase RecQ
MPMDSELNRYSSVENLTQTLYDLFGYAPRPQQVDAIATLAFQKQDLILIAPTGWGKSMIFQAVPIILGGICLMIMLLDLLEEDQVS